jgi:prevent-host-death family protein
MGEVTIRELRNHGGDVIERVEDGERLIVTRAGRPVAELRPVPSPALGAAALLRRWRTIPAIDGDVLRRDVDTAIDPRL